MISCHDLIGNEPIELSEGLLKLANEHKPLRDLLDGLFTLCNQVEENSFIQLIEEVKNFSTKIDHHSVREENYLFRVMEGYLGKEGGPITVMEYEHEQARGFIDEFMEKTKSYSPSTPDEMNKLALLIKNAYYTLLDHFAKEEQVLFPMAERLLSQDEKDMLNEKL